ncbi:hypothetical protein [Elizabethkingia anophelis]|uniref:hypothetical protein n=1 Tax=Elizabethkingia anophelis TaxID=1117645 RepID=UPI000442C2D4|nr:hypothetical protein [Elizabethkingia anophelis]MCT4012783.1 hypothetical protein [Elizabethkingia anophelis]MDV3896313.1 hypothetical protein [Elizabethkingia anophelis]OPC52843.1 hypothetical protein BAY06_01735 [Elizabethkingia anophelis]CDN74434.1 hypothetical protein E18064_290298 [Elizabethkingia anophelis]CDN78262.1 hypothetical protein E27107_280297 [Elizabethkingia anophelis]
MKIKFYHFFLVILIGLGIIACTRDESVSNSSQNGDDLLLQKAKAWFQENTEFAKKNNSSGFNVTNLQLNWDKKTFIENKAGTKILVVPVEETSENSFYAYSEMNFLLEKDGTPYGLYKMYQDYPFWTSSKMEIYSGTGQLITQGYYDFNTKSMKPYYKLRTTASVIRGLAYAGDGDDDIERNHDIKEVIITNPKPVTGPTSPVIVPPTTNPGFPTNPGGGGSGGGSWGSTPPSPEQWTSSDHVRDSEVKKNKCLDEVYTRLKNSSGLFNNLLGNFKGNTILNLNFSIRSMGADGNIAITEVDRVSSQGYVNIAFNGDVLGSSRLFIAGTIIHEMLHAKLTYDLVNAGWDGRTDNLPKIDPESLPTLLEYYRKNNYKEGRSEHEFLSNYYIPKVKAALAQFDGYQQSDSVYEALAWKGLQSTNTYRALPEGKRTSIAKDILNNFNPVPCGK